MSPYRATLMNELHIALGFLQSHLPWLKPLLFWMGIFRAVIKCFSGPLQRFLMAFLLFLAADSFDVDRLLGNKWYRLVAWLLDYFLSVKLPATRVGNTATRVGTGGKVEVTAVAAVIAAAMIFWVLATLTGCVLPGQGNAPQYSPVPGPSKSPQLIYPETSNLEVLPARGKVTNGKLIIAPRQFFVAWDYGDTNGIVFELHRATSVAGPYSHWTNVPQKLVAMPTDAPSGFFKVRASNVVSHLVSDWATTRTNL